MIPFNERVKTVLVALKTTPYRFANQYGLNRASLFNIVNQEKRPSFDLVERICGVEPRISAEYILRGEGEPLRDIERARAMTTAEQLRRFKAEVNELIDTRLQQLES